MIWTVMKLSLVVRQGVTFLYKNVLALVLFKKKKLSSIAAIRGGPKRDARKFANVSSCMLLRMKA